MRQSVWKTCCPWQGSLVTSSPGTKQAQQMAQISFSRELSALITASYLTYVNVDTRLNSLRKYSPLSFLCLSIYLLSSSSNLFLLSSRYRSTKCYSRSLIPWNSILLLCSRSSATLTLSFSTINLICSGVQPLLIAAYWAFYLLSSCTCLFCSISFCAEALATSR